MVRKGLVFDIGRSSTVDGPGIRTVVFLKGCPLACLWCQNPESQKPFPEIRWNFNKCIGCKKCIEACPQSAISLVNNRLVTDRNLCINCGACTEVCSAQARELCGKYMTVEEVFDLVKRDMVFYLNTGGGVTVSGGESTMQAEFLIDFLKKCKEVNIHTALDTCGYTKWGVLKNILQYTDLVLFDLKQMDPEKHYKYTGVPLDNILKNLKKIDGIGVSIWIRTPVVPSYTDDEENITKISSFIFDLKHLKKFELLPYISYGRQKYPMLDRIYQLKEVEPPSLERMNKLKEVAKSKGIKEVYVS